MGDYSANWQDEPDATSQVEIYGSNATLRFRGGSYATLLFDAEGTGRDIWFTRKGIAGTDYAHFLSNSNNVEWFGSQQFDEPVTLQPANAPANPSAGTMYFDTSSKHFFGYDGTIWKQLDN